MPRTKSARFFICASIGYKSTVGYRSTMESIEHGWLTGVRHAPSPNFDRRPVGTTIDLLVIHNISLPPGEFGASYIEQFFCNQLNCDLHPYFQMLADVRVSAHCLINREGEVIQFVSFDDRAWHAGESSFAGREPCNDFSIGIELEGTDDQDYAAAQYQSLVNVTQTIMRYYPDINKQRIVGHSDIAPLRKTDPGPAFAWQHYLQQLL